MREARTAGGIVGFLYAVNILGASAGALLTPWVLVRALGIRGAVAGRGRREPVRRPDGPAVLALLRAAARPRREPTCRPRRPPASRRGPARRFALWVALYALSGFCALALEMLWFRILDVAVKSTAFTFGTVLAIYLLGAGIGCLLGVALVPRLKRPLRAFLLCQCLLLPTPGWRCCCWRGCPPTCRSRWYYAYWAAAGVRARRGLGRRDLLPGCTCCCPRSSSPPTLLMGLSFPALQRAVQDDVRTSGRKVGLLQAANIAGCVAGSLLVGLLAARPARHHRHPAPADGGRAGLRGVGLRLGTRAAVRLLAAALALLAAVLPGAAAASGRGCTAARTGASSTRTRPASAPRAAPASDAAPCSWTARATAGCRSAACTAAWERPRPSSTPRPATSRSSAWAPATPPGRRLPARDALVDVFEISAPQPRLLERLAARDQLPELRRCWRTRGCASRSRTAATPCATAQARLRHDRGRRALAPRGLQRQPLLRRVLRRVRPRLKPGGLMCTWAPTPHHGLVHAGLPARLAAPPAARCWSEATSRCPTTRMWRCERWARRVCATTSDPVSRTTSPTPSRGWGRELSTPAAAARLNEDLYPRDEFGLR